MPMWSFLGPTKGTGCAISKEGPKNMLPIQWLPGVQISGPNIKSMPHIRCRGAVLTKLVE